MRVASFEEIQADFVERAHRMVWCSAASVDGQGRPRSRVVHPIWEGPVGWITTDRRSFKGRHLARSPYLSLAYVGDVAKPAYADCRAEWADDPAVQRHVWDLCLNTPPPLGFDPAPIYRGIDGPTPGTLELGVIKLVPYRIVLTQWPDPLSLWIPEDEAAWFAAVDAATPGGS